MPLDERLVDEAITEASKRGENLDYFFDQLQSPEWIEPLQKRGFFAEPPLQLVDEENLVRAPRWSESQYLARMAKATPDLVLDVIETIKTNNERIVEDFVDAALAMPIVQAERLAALIERWIRERDYLYYLAPRKTVELISRLVSAKAVGTAMTLMTSLFAPLPHDRKDAWRTSPRSRFSAWEYDQHLRKLVSEAVPVAPRELVLALVQLLGQALDFLREGSEAGDYDASRVWRPRIGDDRDRATDVEEALTSALRDASVQIRSQALLSDADLVTSLSARDDELFTRIAMFALAAEPQPDLGVVRPLVVNSAELTEGEPSPEFRELLTGVAERLAPGEIQLLADAVMQGPELEGYRRRSREWDGEEPSDEQVESYRAYWQIGRLALLADALKGATRAKYDALVAEHGEAEIPVSFEVSTFMGPTSPRSAEELEELDDDELVEYLRAWRQGQQRREEPSLEGLARAMSVVTERNPDRISRLAPRLTDVAPAHIQWILHGFELAVGEDQPFDWPTLLDLLSWVAAQPREISGGRGDDYDDLDPGWVWTRREIAGLLERGLNARGVSAIPSAERSRVWQILAAISEDPDPTPEHEQRYGGQNMDPTTLSLNTTRPRALRAVFAYAVWIYHSKYGDDQSPEGIFTEIPEVQALLSEHLDSAHDPSSSVRAVFGQHFANLVALDRKWAADLADLIFPTEDSALREAAWGSYVIFTPPYNNVLSMLRDHYLRSAELAGNASRHGFKWMSGDPDEKLGEHIATFLWRGIVTLSDPLFTAFWSKASPSARAHMVEFLGRSAREVPIAAELQQRLTEFWAWVADNVGDDHDDASTVLREFAWWFGADDLPPEWRLRELEAVFARKIQPEPAFLVAEQLPAIAERHPLEAVRALRSLLEQGDAWSVDAWREHVQDVLYTAAHSDDPESVRVAQAVLDWLLMRGYRDLRALIEADQSPS